MESGWKIKEASGREIRDFSPTVSMCNNRRIALRSRDSPATFNICTRRSVFLPIFFIAQSWECSRMKLLSFRLFIWLAWKLWGKGFMFQGQWTKLKSLQGEEEEILRSFPVASLPTNFMKNSMLATRKYAIALSSVHLMLPLFTRSFLLVSDARNSRGCRRLVSGTISVAFRASRDELAFAYFNRTEVAVEFLTPSPSLINNVPYGTARAPI